MGRLTQCRLMLSKVWERARLPDRRIAVIDGEPEVGESTGDDGSEYLVEFCLEMGQPIWRYDLGTAVIEKQVLMPHLQNTVYVMYRLVSGDERVRLTLRPSYISARTMPPSTRRSRGPMRSTWSGIATSCPLLEVCRRCVWRFAVRRRRLPPRPSSSGSFRTSSSKRAVTAISG